MLQYFHPQGVQPVMISGRPGLSTREGGVIIVDDSLLSVWKAAHQSTLEALCTQFSSQGLSRRVVQASVACLAEAGLVERDTSLRASEKLFLTGKLASIVIVGYNNRSWLDDCLSSLKNQTYSPLEIILVDNASSDGTSAWLVEHFPGVVLIRNEEQRSFAGAINQGVALAKGAFILLLNPDVSLERDAIAQMVAAAEENAPRAIIAAKLKFSWAPTFINGLGNSVGPFHWGTDTALGHLDLGQFDSWQEIPSACFAAALLSREAWQLVGPVDEGFPMYYEDAEWSYRARGKGLKIILAPKAIVYHAGGGRTIDDFAAQADKGLRASKLRNVIYGRLRFALKIAHKSLWRFLCGYLFEDILIIIMALLRGDRSRLRACTGAWRDAWRDLPELRKMRAAISKERLLSDAELFYLQRTLPAPLVWRGLPELTVDIISNHYLPLIEAGKTRTLPEYKKSSVRMLIISHDIVDVKMAGPGMRYVEMAKALSDALNICLAIPAESRLEAPGIRLERYSLTNPDSLRSLVDASDVVLFPNFILDKFPFLEKCSQRLVVDLYDPFVLENLHIYLDEPVSVQRSLNEQAVSITNRLAQVGDFFICGNERQRDYWMGLLTANGRINPLTFSQDHTLRGLIDVVGIGLPGREVQPRPFLRGIHPQVSQEAKIVLWGGGIWNWLDPLTLIRAWPQVIAQSPQARLVFLGTRHPNPQAPLHIMAIQAEELAQQIGEKDRTIIFIEWVDYTKREYLLTEADIGVMLHPIHVETRLSIRTRVLDYIWARLPILITDGDITSEWVRQYKIGKVVQPFDEKEVAQALLEMLGKPKSEYAAYFSPLHETYTWERVVEPLRRFCLEGQPAPDRERLRRQALSQSQPVVWRWRFSRAWYILCRRGGRELAHRLWRYIQWRYHSRTTGE